MGLPSHPSGSLRGLYIRSSSSSSSAAPASPDVFVGGGGGFDCSSNSCSRSRAVSENRRSTFDLVSLIVRARDTSRELVRWVRSAEARSLDFADDWFGVEDACGAARSVPLGFAGGLSAVACLAVAFKCFLDVR
jgi:hypothetical protein